jgi:hypothetical protein
LVIDAARRAIDAATDGFVAIGCVCTMRIRFRRDPIVDGWNRRS